MSAKFLKAATLVVLALFTSVAIAQDDAAATDVPAGPTPQEVAAQNMSDLLNLVSRVGPAHLQRTVPASSDLHKIKRISSQNSIVLSGSAPLKSGVQPALRSSLRTMSY